MCLPQIASYDYDKRRVLCKSPPHASGTVYVEVGVQGVFSFASGVQFSYEPPMLYSIYPTRGPTWGEMPITLTGTNFKNLDDRGEVRRALLPCCSWSVPGLRTLTPLSTPFVWLDGPLGACYNCSSVVLARWIL